MTIVLHLPARAGAPIACDMSTATDTPDERLAEYARLLDGALVRRERRAHAVVFAFRSAPGVRERVENLARREAACCPFLGYRVETAGAELVFSVTGPEGADADAILDAFYALPDSPPSCGTGGRDPLSGSSSTGTNVNPRNLAKYMSEGEMPS